MEAKIHRASQLVRHAAGVHLLVLLLTGATNSSAHDEWFRGLDLEPALGEASLVMVGRVVDVSETKIMMGGKVESALLQFKFAPVLVLKGVFSRESLSLTSQDLGIQRFTDSAPIEPGQVRLLMLGRSSQGYAILRPSPRFEQTIPPLNGQTDELIATIKVLLEVNATPERPNKVALLHASLQTERGPAAIPLLASLERRSLLAAQTVGVVEVVSGHLNDPSPAVREQAARTLHSLLEADYLEQRALREAAASALAAALGKADSNVAPRVAVLQALGATGHKALDTKSTKALLGPDPFTTFAEQGARIHAVGQLQLSSQQGAVLAVLKQLPLDAPPGVQSSAEWALGRLDPTGGVHEVTLRLKNKYDVGFPVVTEISSLADLSPTDAVPALVEVSKLPLDHAERHAFVMACRKIAEKVADRRLVAPLAVMLAPNEPDVRWGAIEALTKIDTEDAAKALQPHLSEETNLTGKLKVAEFLGRHGIPDGYPYAIEHMSEPYLREQAISALATIREPRAVGELRKILATSNDIAWNSAAVRGLGRLGVAELAPQFLEMARNAKNPLAASALIALGDLHETRAVATVRAGLASRNTELLIASARAAGNLAALPGVAADDVRDQLASLLADPGAPLEARAAAVDSLVTLNDARLDGALSQAVRDGGLEEGDLLNKIEKLLQERKIKLTLP
jgi:HEAT repeat protein